MTKRKMGQMLVAVAGLVVLAALATGFLNRSTVESYYSPVDFELIRKTPSVTVSNPGDHDQISYHPPCSGKDCISEIVEARWEDGSAFAAFAGGRRIFFLPEAGPYWAYRQDEDIELFFLDYPMPPFAETASYSELPYGYTLIKRTKTDTRQYQCTFDFSRWNSPPSSRRAVDTQVENPFMLPISKFLSEHGADLKADKCRLEKTLN